MNTVVQGIRRICELHRAGIKLVLSPKIARDKSDLK